jgi:hypothetical protein
MLFLMLETSKMYRSNSISDWLADRSKSELLAYYKFIIQRLVLWGQVID